MIYLLLACLAAIWLAMGALFVAALLLDPDLTAEPSSEHFA